jgi:hypothetical protein
MFLAPDRCSTAHGTYKTSLRRVRTVRLHAQRIAESFSSFASALIQLLFISEMSRPAETKRSPQQKLTKGCLSTRKFTPGAFENDIPDNDSPKKRVTITTTDTTPKPVEISIPRAGRSNAPKFTVPDTDKVFGFKCSGEIGGDSLVAGKRVEWKAKFDRPIEELIYPSLQRFDFIDYERRQRNRLKQLHEHHGSAKTPSQIKYFNNHETEHQIKLDPIPPHLLPANQDIVYVHTPQWTVKLTDNHRPRSRSNTKDLKCDESVDSSSEKVPYADIGEELDLEGERYLRGRMRASIVEREEERQRKEKLAMGFLAGLSRRQAIDLQPVALTPNDSANVLVSHETIVYLVKCQLSSPMPC